MRPPKGTPEMVGENSSMWWILLYVVFGPIALFGPLVLVWLGVIR